MSHSGNVLVLLSLVAAGICSTCSVQPICLWFRWQEQGQPGLLSDPVVFQVTLIIIQEQEKPAAARTAANTSLSNLSYCPGPRNGEHKTKLRIILLFPAYTRNKDLFFLLQLWMFRTLFSLICLHSLAPDRLSPQGIVVILSKIIVQLWKRFGWLIVFVYYRSYHLYSSYLIFLIPSV